MPWPSDCDAQAFTVEPGAMLGHDRQVGAPPRYVAFDYSDDQDHRWVTEPPSR
jgi:hypothetical protein